MVDRRDGCEGDPGEGITPGPEEFVDLRDNQERLDALPQVLVGDDTVILVEAPTGVCFVYAPYYNDGASIRREGFLLPVTVERREVPPQTIFELLERVEYIAIEKIDDCFWRPVGRHPMFEQRAVDPRERVQCITVRTEHGRGWLLGDELWEKLHIERWPAL